MRKTAEYKEGMWRSGMIDFDETYSVDARDGHRIYARLIPELNVVGVYRDGQLLFSLTGKEAYNWATNISILTVYTVSNDEQKTTALEHLATGAKKPGQ